MIIEASAGQAFTEQLRRAASEAQILGVAGGDGSISTACAVALEAGLPLLVIPAGTFNHLAATCCGGTGPDAPSKLTSRRRSAAWELPSGSFTVHGGPSSPER